MSVNKITDRDLINVGVIGLEDSPGLSKADMQAKFEETVRKVAIPKINELIEQSNATAAIANETATDLEDLTLVSGNVTTSQVQRWDGKSDLGINLLHNVDWAYSLVNQRGHSGAVSDAYCIDRWIGNGSVTPVAGTHIALASGTSMTQRMEILPSYLGDKQLTFSIDIDGESQSVPLVFPSVGSVYSNGTSLDGCDVELGFISSSGTSICGVQSTAIPYLKLTSSANIDVKRPFLELGKVSHMAETLPRDYSVQSNCAKRYYQRISRYCVIGATGFSAADTIHISLEAEMRVKPTAKSELVSCMAVQGGVSSPITSVVGVTPTSYACKTATDTKLATRTVTAIYLNSIIELIADL